MATNFTATRDNALESKSNQETIIENTKIRQRALEQNLIKLQAELAQLKKREGELAGTMAKYRQERAPLDQEAARLLTSFNNKQVEYRAILE